MLVWIVNPFDPLPGESDVPLRYWALCRTLAKAGHGVVWWSSSFSHLTKTVRRQPAGPIEVGDGAAFNLRLIDTAPYRNNVGLARLRNHRQFAHRFYRDARQALDEATLPPPDRIVISLPPLGLAEAACRLRDEIQRDQPAKTGPAACEVVVDLMDAWPDTFYQLLPPGLRPCLGRWIFAPLHRRAAFAINHADKISAVGQSYLDWAKSYLPDAPSTSPGSLRPGPTSGSCDEPRPAAREAGDTQAPRMAPTPGTGKPMYLCYHGTDLERFDRQPERDREETALPELGPEPAKPILLYLGSMGRGYDLMTLIELAARWQARGQFPYQLHLAGTGPLEPALRQAAEQKGLLPEGRVRFHGLLNRADATRLLLEAELALVPNRPASLVACPYKAAEYAAAGLPLISCLGGELGGLIRHFEAGTEYKEGDVESLDTALKKYSQDPDLLQTHGQNSRRMAATLFDRSKTYPGFAEFILS